MTAPRIFPRSSWGALAPRQTVSRNMSDVRTVYAHYSDQHESIPPPTHAHDVLIIQAIQRYHMNAKRYFDIAYAVLIGGNGDIFLGRSPNVVEAAVAGHNRDGCSICFLTDGPITPSQERSFQYLVGLAILAFPNVAHRPQPHSAGSATACPGDTIRAWLATFPH